MMSGAFVSRVDVKYVLCPGVVTSMHDGQRHFITAEGLAQLYGVPMEACLIHNPQEWWPQSYHRQAEDRQRGLIRLAPKYDGNYTLPKEL